MITIDNYTWNIPCDVSRTSEVMSSEISGMMLNKAYFNDVIGTYLTYDVSIVVPPSIENQYSVIYEILTDPVGSHRFALPYNQTIVEVEGRVESVRDTLVYTPSRMQYWRGISFSITANHPTKEEDYETVISRGMPTMPDVYTAVVGDVYELTAGGWQPYVIPYPDVDDRKY